ncbi:hypothetical protein M2263_002046 [Providencia alcalifaciens]|nr:hypothetical protein [Providencia alcalifaciens]
MAFPTYLPENLILLNENEILTEVYLGFQASGDLFTICHNGQLFLVQDEPMDYIVAKENSPLKIVAKHSISGKEIMIFDGSLYGYDAMFCDEPGESTLLSLPLIQYNFPPSALKLSFFYNIDYEDEKDNYEFNAQGDVNLINGHSMSWENVKRNGFDAFTLTFLDANENELEVVSLELA